MIKQSNNLNMKKFYTLLLCALSVFAISAQGPMKAKGDVTYYDGEVNISMSGMELADGMPVTITLEEGENSNVYELVLADFELALMPGQEPILLGDIVVPNVAFMDDNGDGISDVTGTIDDVSLAEGQINAKVDISGESRQDGSLDLTIDVLWYPAYPDKDTTMPIAVTFVGGLRTTTYYDGVVSISMLGTELADGKPVSIALSGWEYGNYYELVLADFELALMPGQEPILLGDIVVPNVAFMDDNGDGISDVTGTIDDVSLAEGQINAKVDISGESRQDGSLDLTIDVLWYSAYPDKDTTIPIAVTFTGEKRNGGIAGIVDNGAKVYGVAGAVKVDGYNGVAEVYSVDGRMIKKQMVSDGSQIDLASGLYIVRVADKSVKVAVR